MSADLELQKAIRARLIATPAVTALVPAASILDRHERPAPKPSIILGESQTVDEGDSISRSRQRIYADLHVWVGEPGTEGAKAIVGAIRAAIHSGRLILSGTYHCADARVSNVRILRDPDGVTSHAVITIDALVLEAQP